MIKRPDEIPLTEIAYDENASSSNKSRGQVTTVRQLHEFLEDGSSNPLPTYETTYSYETPEGLVSKQVVTPDWNYDDATFPYTSQYFYL